ncbi:endo-1,4-beta-xylanase [Leeuwenhoekiella palythoae]|uniref:Beta-xylanase n=1 Tax=Leeuwenhoekiella palythoae TaxID=573501 RepID=A0A1M5YDL0_9FLAO|nr:endo-1,4-beta-xylanase [Leeuwenhoekiella palythoae]RXG30644.1 endo-1,4-beta-xylanase [Leeuwenhoekiella palythoae]SHI09593.1 endo-1,4-beta-xylanase [Leeuwenhoekiella palythoae]
MNYLSSLILIAILLVNCKSDKSEDVAQLNEKPLKLKEALADKFLIGTALNARQIAGYHPEELAVVRENFNSIVAENCMKSERLVANQDVYDFTTSDKFVNFGIENNMVVHGHTLIWHSQTPKWFFKDSLDQEITREELIQRMKNHIHTVVTRYKGKIKTWDVVNEAVLDDGTLRKSKFYNLLGEDFIKMAFEFAHEADPEAELYYNDYSTAVPEKREGIVRMVKKLQEQGVPIHGIGMQGHVGMDYPELEEFEKSITAFANLGLKVSITEFDITVLPSPWKNQGAEVSANFQYKEAMNPYPEKLPDTVSNALNQRYLEFFKLFLKHHKKIDKVTLWGVNDGNSWRNDWPVAGRTDYPLLFDRDNKPKSVVDSIIAIAKK